MYDRYKNYVDKMEVVYNINIRCKSYNKVYIIDIVHTLLYDGGIKGDDKYVDGTGYNCKKRMERGL